jgi:uncharacterized protein with PIN domain
MSVTFREMDFANRKAILDSFRGKSEVTFLLDSMLGSLARKLRILGFDTLYDSSSQDHALIDAACRSARILITSDFDLYGRACRSGIKSLLVKTSADEERLTEIFSKLGMHRLPSGEKSRCSVCNGELEICPQSDRDPSPIFRCLECGKLYWKGGHWKKLDLLFSEVNRTLEGGYNQHEKF